jgi:hypothetical protein
MFWKTVLPPSSGSQNKPSNQEHVSAKPVLQLLAEEEKENCLSAAPGMLESAETNENFVINIVTDDVTFQKIVLFILSFGASYEQCSKIN